MKNNIESQIEDLQENEEKYILELVSCSDKKVDNKLSLIQQQMDMAIEQHNEDVMPLLQLKEQQIIVARYLKIDKQNTPQKKKKRK